MTLLLTAVAAYLLVGMGLCVKGKLATKISYDVAITSTFNKLPTRKVWLYLMLLRLGVVLGWPAFWVDS